MAATLEAEHAFGTEDLESGPKVVKFAVIQGHQGEGAQEHELASFEAMMLPHMDAAHNLASGCCATNRMRKTSSRKRICARSNRSAGSMVPMGGRGCSQLSGTPATRC
jgi:hypothetical protein